MTYNGLVDNVISDFNIATQINTAGSQLTMEVGVGFQDVGATAITSNLIDNNGEAIIDDMYFNILASRELSLGTVPSVGDRIDVYEYSAIYPDGKIVFTGRVTGWDTDFGNNVIRYSLLSYGVELGNYLLSILAESTVTESTTSNSVLLAYSEGAKFPLNRINGAGQSFQLISTYDISTIRVKIANSGTFQVPTRLSLYSGTPVAPGSLLAYIDRNIPNQTATLTDYTFTTPITLSASTSYFWQITNTWSSDSTSYVVNFSYDSTAPYTSGVGYQYNESTGWSVVGGDFTFALITSSGGVGNQFTATDPSDIIRTALDTFVAQGGSITYTADSIADTGTTVDYTFKFNTYLDVIQKCTELAPAFWYFYVDPATNILYFQPRSTTADHTMILQKHFSNMKIGYSIENVKNNIYLTGGDDGTGTNILVSDTSPASILQYGSWLDLPNDTRATTTAQATTLLSSMLAEKSEPKFQISFDVVSTLYDITTFSAGQMVAFYNFNTLVDTLLLQIISVNYKSDVATINVDQLPMTQVRQIDNIRRGLLEKTTENNPGTI